MPSLSELGLNRYLYRDNTELDTSNALSSAFKDISGEQGGAYGTSGNQASSTTNQASAIAPGSVIQSSTIQSSPGDNRVEINPNDTFRAFRNGAVVVLIDQNGIVAEDIEVENLTVENADVDVLNVNEIVYDGVPLPVTFTGIVSSLGVGVILPSGWTSVQNGVGDYTITHNLNSASYTALVTPITGHFRGQVLNQTVNTFDVTWQESDYAAGLYTGEIPVDVGFAFAVFEIL